MTKSVNYYFLVVSVVLTVFGMLFLANLSAPSSLQLFGNTNYYLFHQLYALLIGLALAAIAFKVPLSFIKKITPFLFFANIALLLVVFLPYLGIELWGAKRWINIGGNTIQPSEFLKVTAVLYLAAWVSNKFSKNSSKGWSKRARGSYKNFTGVFLPFVLLLTVISIILLFQRDLGTLSIVAASLMAVYFVAGTPLWHTILTVAGSIAGGLLFIRIEPYRIQRLLTFFNPESDPLGRGFQLSQALMAIGSGGIFGRGWGMSSQKFGILPQSMSDSVFAILGEETGMIGCSILIVLLLLLFWQGIKIAKHSSDRFSKLTVVGIMTWLIIQAFMNISSSLGLFPLTGIPLPFFSYGGSHLIAEMVAVGLLLNISKNG